MNRTASGHDARKGCAPHRQGGRRGAEAPLRRQAGCCKGAAPRPHCRGRAVWHKSEEAKAAMAECAKRADNRATKERVTLARSRAGASRALARARTRTKNAASLLQRPPTSTARTTAAKALGMLVPCGGAPQPALRLPSAAPAGHSLARQGRHQGGVDSKLLAIPKRQAVGNDFKPPVVDSVDLQIHVCQTGVASDTGPRLTANPRGAPFQRTTSLPKNP